MDIFERWFEQDLTKKVGIQHAESLAFSGNNASNVVGVYVYKDGAPADLNGTVTGTVIRPDGMTVPLTGTLSGNAVSAVLTEACFAVPGYIGVALTVTSGNITMTVLKATFEVEPIETDTVVDPSGEIAANVAELISDIEAAVAAIPPSYSDLLAAVAPTFDPEASTPYQSGAYVWYSGALYRFTADHTGAWTGTDAVSVNVGEEISEVKSAFEEITETTISRNLYDKSSCNPSDQAMYNSSGAFTQNQASYATTGKIPCNAQTEYTFNAGGARIKALRYFSGESGSTFISGDTYDIPLTQTTFTTPEHCTFVAVNLFANTHTTNEYNTAINASQLELGDEATPYMPFGNTCHVPLAAVEDGGALKEFANAVKSVSSSDVGKTLRAKTIEDGQVTEWEFSDAVEVDDTLSQSGKAADAKAVGDAIAAENAIIDSVTDVHVSKNLYNKTACLPTDGYTYNSSGNYTASSVFATSGKIPVEPSTQYIFSAGRTKIYNVRYFKGETGGTFISGESISNNGPFTTPAECTFVAVNLFGVPHTTAEYNTAIAVAQLEKGSTATPYEPYGDSYYIPLDAVENGTDLAGLSTLPVIESPINLYNKALAVDGKYYFSNGSVQNSADNAITGLIPVKPNTQYNISRDPDSPMAFAGTVKLYKSDGTFISNATLGNYVYDTLYAFTTTAETAYIGVTLSLESHTTQDFEDTINSIMLCFGTLRPEVYSAYNEESVIPAEKLSNAYLTRDNFAGKKWLATGTSITWYDGKAYQAGLHEGELCRGYIGIVTSHKRLNVVNEGISGSTLANVSSSSLINRYQDLNWASFDIATLEYGVNDLGRDIPVGTASDAAGTDTFAACLKTVIEYALAQNPKIILIICTDPDVRGANTNNNGNTLKDFSDVTIAVAAQYRLPVCDWYYHSGINALNKGDQSKDWMTVDGTHPSDAGHQRMGAMLIQTLESVID